MPKSEKKLPELHSKSQLKRDMLKLQKIGKNLIELSLVQLEKIPLTDTVREAIELSHTLKSNEAKRRHLQYIGKLMRSVDPEPIEAALDKIKNNRSQETRQLHKIEEWRDKLIEEGDQALQLLLTEYPDADRQRIRQLTLQAKRDRSKTKNTGGETALFRLLREIIQEAT